MAAQSETERKIQEGDEHMKNAEKCLKTGLFKWKADTDGAVSELQKAGAAYHIGKDLEMAIHAYLRCGDIQKRRGSWLHAGESYEAAAMIYKERNQLMEAAILIESASLHYLRHGTPVTAAMALDRAGKIVEQMNFKRAVELYMRAVDVCEDEDRPWQSAQMAGKAARLLIRHRVLDEAAKALKMEMDFYARTDNHGMRDKLVMVLVLIHLHQGDSVAAEQAFQSCLSYPGFAESDEAPLIQMLLQAYKEGDDTIAYKCIHSPLFKYIGNDFMLELACDLHIPGSKSPKPGATSPDANEEDEDCSRSYSEVTPSGK